MASVRSKPAAACSGRENNSNVPPFIARFLRRGDGLTFLASGNDEILIERRNPGDRPIQLLYPAIGYVGQPKERANGAGFFVRADLPNCSTGPRVIFLAGDAIRRYFYLVDDDNRQTLYDLLRTSDSASPADLRLAWRVRNLELAFTPANAAEHSKLERAFNVLAHTDLRNCYDALRRRAPAISLWRVWLHP